MTVCVTPMGWWPIVLGAAFSTDCCVPTLASPSWFGISACRSRPCRDICARREMGVRVDAQRCIYSLDARPLGALD